MTQEEYKLHYEWKTLLEIYPDLSWSGKSFAKKRINEIRKKLDEIVNQIELEQ